MKRTELITWLSRIRDGVATAEELEAARQAARQDERIPDEIGQALWDDPVTDAVGLLALLGAEPSFGEVLASAIQYEAGPGPGSEVDDDWSPLGEALRAGLDEEARGFDVSDAVLALLGEERAPLAEAVRAEAGFVDVTDEVETSLALAGAVRAEAGTIDVVDDVTLRLGLVAALQAEAGVIDIADAVLATLHADTVPVADAVRGEAGEIDIVDLVLFRTSLADALRAEAGTVDVADQVLRDVRRSALAPGAHVPSPANQPGAFWRPALVAFAAAALLSVVGVRSFVGVPHSDAYELQFASASEIIVDDLDYGADVNVQVFQGSDDNSPLIIWVDEETI